MPLTKPRSTPADHQRLTRSAIRHLRRVSPRLGRIIDHVGPFEPKITPDPFLALTGSIIHQQVSMQAATTIHGRVRDLCPRRRITPPTLLRLSTDDLRGAGVSRQKAGYLQNVARAFASRELTRAGLHRMTDDEVIAVTTRIKGVGRWTAEMLLIFSLQRPDVWPVDDLGLRNAVARFLSRDEPPTVAKMNELAEPWRPYRTYATWYLWRSLEGPILPGLG